jgi:hypothetical protein
VNKFTLSIMLSSALLLTVISLSSATTSLSGQSPSTSTAIRVVPSPVSALLGDTLRVNITVTDVSDMAGYGFKLYWLRDKLNGTSILEGPFLKQAGSTYFNVVNFMDNYNSTHGLAWVTSVLLGPGPGVYGSGAVASISFKAKNIGSTGLWLSDTMLVDSAANKIPHTDVSGKAYITFHNIAVTKVKPWKTVVGQGYSAKVNVTVQNQGNFTETFNVTAFASGKVFGSLLNVKLSNGTSTTITFTWNTTGFAMGNYTINATATPVPRETDTTDNTYVDGKVQITIPGDVNGDRRVTWDDLSTLGLAYASKPGDSNWNPNADINCDGRVTWDDLSTLGLNYGKSC